MKKQIGDHIKHLSPFGYFFEGTVTGIIHESPGQNIYEVEFNGQKGRLPLPDETKDYDDDNTYWPKPKPGTIQEVRLIGFIRDPTQDN